MAKLANISQLIKDQTPSHRFYGLFIYDDGPAHIEDVLNALRAAANGHGSRVINCICLGENRFIRYWEIDPLHCNRPYYKWRAYELNQEAQGYFIHNVIEGISPQSVAANSAVWFPEERKEGRLIGEIPFSDAPPAI